MKTKELLLLSLLLIFTGCQESEFYEKEYLEGLGVPDDIADVVNNPTDPIGPNDPNDPTDPTDPTDPGVCGTGTLVETNDQFVQNTAQQGAVDILWVVDNSVSMGNEQDDLARNFDIFIQDFIQRGTDFQMAITTTDGRSGYNGNMINAPDQLNAAAARANEVQFMDDFRNLIRVGTSGSGTEMGLHTSESFVNRYSSWFRDSAYLIIVYVSDEEDQSSNTVDEYIQAYQSIKGQAGLVKLYSIVTTAQTGRSWETIGERYIEAATKTGGLHSSIHDDFYNTLQNFGGSILNLLDSFPLSNEPADTQIRITVDGQEVAVGWTYDASTRSIRFDQNAIPNEGEVVIAYYRACQ